MKKAPVIRTPFLRKPKLKLKDSKKSQLINSHGNFNFRWNPIQSANFAQYSYFRQAHHPIKSSQIKFQWYFIKQTSTITNPWPESTSTLFQLLIAKSKIVHTAKSNTILQLRFKHNPNNHSPWSNKMDTIKFIITRPRKENQEVHKLRKRPKPRLSDRLIGKDSITQYDQWVPKDWRRNAGNRHHQNTHEEEEEEDGNWKKIKLFSFLNNLNL